MTTASLKALAHKDLAQLARQGGVRGWHAMRKDQLITALLGVAKAKASEARASKKVLVPARRNGAARKPAGGSKPRASVSRRPAAAVQSTRRPAAVRRKANPRVIKHLQKVQAKLARSKDITVNGTGGRSRQRDRLVLMVRDAFWLHVCWQLMRRSVERAAAAMGQDWHTARPHLRLLEVTDGGTTSASERIVREVEIHGGVSNWYLHMEPSSKSYRVEIGYLSSNGRFFSLCRSNVVTMPSPGSCDSVDEHWADVANNYEKIYAMSGGYSSDGASELQELFEERLRRPMSSPMASRYGGGLEGLLPHARDLDLSVDADLVVYGSAAPDAHLSLRGEPVRLRSDGSFMVRMNLANQRQVIPLVAYSADGGQQRTVVLAIERNTKVMEPVVREAVE
jgi:hypothetical protein